MTHTSLSDKLLRASAHLLPAGVICADVAIWALLLPGQALAAL